MDSSGEWYFMSKFVVVLFLAMISNSFAMVSTENCELSSVQAVECVTLEAVPLPDVGKESIATRALKKPGDAWRDSFGFFHAKNNYGHEYFFDANWNCYYLAPDQWIDSAGTIYWEDAKGIERQRAPGDVF